MTWWMGWDWLFIFYFWDWDWESIRLLRSSRRLLPTLNFGWRTGRTGHLNLAINCRLRNLEIGYAWGVGFELANMRAKRHINPCELNLIGLNYRPADHHLCFKRLL